MKPFLASRSLFLPALILLAAGAVGLVLAGVVLNAVNAGFRELVALSRRPR